MTAGVIGGLGGQHLLTDDRWKKIGNDSRDGNYDFLAVRSILSTSRAEALILILGASESCGWATTVHPPFKLWLEMAFPVTWKEKKEKERKLIYMQDLCSIIMV